MELFRIGNGRKTLIATVENLTDALAHVATIDTVMFDMEDEEHPGCFDICGVVDTYALEPVVS